MAQAWYNYPIFQGNAYQTQYLGPGTDTPHFAYDIQTPFHTPIDAILPGTVEVADYQAWGGEIFIKPDDPSYPEYYVYHPDLVEVQKNQHVGAGQEIALSGGENPGYPGAEHPASPQWSSGPHTHLGWFTKWYKVPQTGTTIPYGPDTASLLQLAKNTNGHTPLDIFGVNLPGQPGTPGSSPAISSSAVARLGVGAVGVVAIGIGLISLLHASGADSKLEEAGKKIAKVAML